MKIVLAAREVGGRQSQFREPGAVGAPANDGALGFEAGAAHGGFGEWQGPRLLCQPVRHVAVLRRHAHIDLGLGIFSLDKLDRRAQQLSFVRQRRRFKIPEQDANGHFRHTTFDPIRM